jgi:hypothetical protein
MSFSCGASARSGNRDAEDASPDSGGGWRSERELDFRRQILPYILPRSHYSIIIWTGRTVVILGTHRQGKTSQRWSKNSLLKSKEE